MITALLVVLILIILIIVGIVISFIEKNKKIHETETIVQENSKVNQHVENIKENGVALQKVLNILIVDDEQINLIMLNEMLLKLNCNVKFASNGKECIDIFEEENGNFDMIFLDIVMPVMRGSEAFYLMKKIKPDIKVVIATGFVPGTDEIQDMIKAGAVGILQKPYGFIEISNFISKCRD